MGRDLTGVRFGRLVVLSLVRSDSAKNSRWLCHCDCGNDIAVSRPNLRGGHTTSCGCFRKEIRILNGRKSLRHGHGRHGAISREYNTWLSMRRRCDYPPAESYPLYGGRGIRVCERWDRSFEAFLADMGPRPMNCTIDRIDPNGNYEPSNCRWVSFSAQATNRRNTRFLDSRALCVVAKENGINRTVLHTRLKMGWSFTRAATEPVKHKKRRSPCLT